MSEKTITITLARYEALLTSEFELQALENAGVDNWEGCDYAYEGYKEGLSSYLKAHGLDCE